MRDLAITARVEAVLLATDLRIANLEVESHRAEVHISGIIVAEGVKETVIDTIRKIPDVTRSRMYFVITPPDQYLYREAR